MGATGEPSGPRPDLVAVGVWVRANWSNENEYHSLVVDERVTADGVGAVVWAMPGFRRYVASRVAAWVGNAASAVALPVLVYQETGSAALTGLLAAAESLPYLLFGLQVGALVDRWDGRRVMVISALVTAAGLATVPLAALAGALTATHLLAVALVGGISFVFLDAAAFGALPRLVGAERIGAATSVLSAYGTVVGIAIPGAVGVALPAAGGVPILAFDALLCAASALLVSGVAISHTAEPRRPGSSLRGEIAEGLRYIWRHPVIRPLTLLGFGNAFTGGAVLGLIVVVGVRHLGFTDDDGRFGWLYAAAALGAFVGATIVGRLHARLGVGMIAQAGYGLMFVVVIGWATATHWLVGVPLLALEGLVGTVIVLNGIIARQVLTPLRLQGRVNTTARAIAWGGSPLGAALGGALADLLGVGPALYVCAGAVLVAFVGGIWWRLPAVGRLATLGTGPRPG